MYVEVIPGGTRVWRMRYRLDGKQEKVTLGEYPSYSSIEARKWQENNRATVGHGQSSMRIKAEAKAAEKESGKPTNLAHWRGHLDKFSPKPKVSSPIFQLGSGQTHGMSHRRMHTSRSELTRGCEMPINKIQFQPGLSLPEFFAQFGNENQCQAALEQARWPDGFICPDCGGQKHSLIHRESEKWWQCSTCRKQTSLKAGTIFESTRLPLRLWFLGIYHLTQPKNNIAALELKPCLV